jgi:glutamate synthase (NADPH/NADH)
MGRVSFADHVEERAIDEIEEEPTNIYEYQNVPENKSWAGALPMKQGLYDPELEKDACGVGFAAHIKGTVSHKIVIDGMYMSANTSTSNTDPPQHEACFAT